MSGHLTPAARPVTPPATRPQRPGAVYLLPHVNRHRFKVGWSLSPLQRAMQLPEFMGREIDLARSQVAWFPQAHRARQVERALHRSLAPYSVSTGHQGTGRTEWFGMSAIVLARRLLALLPTAEGGARHARLMPLQEQPELDATQTAPALPTEWGALDAWRRIEDLWLRLATTISPIFTQDHGDRQLAWVGFKPRTDTDFLVLRGQVLDLESYRWFEDGRPRSLVSLMQWERDDLRMDLAATRQLARWREGDTLDWHLKGFLAKHAVLSSTGTTRERAA